MCTLGADVGGPFGGPRSVVAAPVFVDLHCWTSQQWHETCFQSTWGAVLRRGRLPRTRGRDGSATVDVVGLLGPSTCPLYWPLHLSRL